MLDFLEKVSKKKLCCSEMASAQLFSGDINLSFLKTEVQESRADLV